MSTRQPISSVTLSASTSSVSFTNIPQTYTDLYLVVSGNSAGGYINTRIRFNSDVGSSYSFTRLGVTFPGNNPTLSAGSEQNATSIRGAQMDNADNQFFTVNIMSYTNTNINKAVLVKTYNSDGGGYGDSPTVVTGLWRNTSAISSIIITTDGTSFASNTTFNLYGIATSGINTGKAIGGDNVYSDGTYWYHTFFSSGTFTPLQALTADYLVVAGGGGGANGSGGGGAGGLRSTVTATGGGGSLESALSLTAQAYTVTVGAGGAPHYTKGSNSVFSTITSEGGGKGGDNGDSATVTAGGSGGGARNATGGNPTANQGFKGGDSSVSQGGGGGGGAGAAGTNCTSNSVGGNGGNGVTTFISGSSVTYAGGGGGAASTGTAGTGGTGGGGNGQASSGTLATAGKANTGSGGGGGWGSNGAAGGSGIVIIRYAV